MSATGSGTTRGAIRAKRVRRLAQFLEDYRGRALPTRAGPVRNGRKPQYMQPVSRYRICAVSFLRGIRECESAARLHCRIEPRRRGRYSADRAR